MPARSVLATAAAVLLLAGAPAYCEDGPRPAVPTTLPGARVVGTDEAAALVELPGTVIVDVSEAPRRPEGLAPGAVWLPSHRDVPGSVWIPGAGRDAISPDLAAFYRARLTALTGSSPDRALLIYCHPNCIGSWNAAKRALEFGYRNVFWYPGGIEAWQDAGRPSALAEPEGPACSQ